MNSSKKLKKNWGNIQQDGVVAQDWINFFGEDSMEAEWLGEHACKQSAGEGFEVLVLADSSSEEEELASDEPVSKEPVSKEPVKAASKSKKKRKGRRRFNAPSGGRDAAKGTGSRDPNQGFSAEQIQEWFSDTNW